MRTQTAKRKKLLFLAAVLALVGAFQATTPAEAARTLNPPITATLEPEFAALDSVGAADAAGDRFALFTTDDLSLLAAFALLDSTEIADLNAENRIRLFADSGPLPRPVERAVARKTASRVFDLGPDCNIMQTGGLSQECVGPSFQGLWTDPTTGLAYARNRWYDARTASWLSEDPMGAVDSPNLYAFVGWAPHMGTDPLGLYGKDFHLHATYYLARAAGLSKKDTRQLAWASQHVDEADQTHPIIGGVDARSSFHFLARNAGRVTPNNEVARSNLERARSDKNLISLGMAIHSYADTWSHQGFSAGNDPKINDRLPDPGWSDFEVGLYYVVLPPFAHARAGHLPDEPYRALEDAMEASREIYSVLVEESASRGVKPNRSWEEIAPTLEAMFRTVGDSDKRISMWEAAIDKDFGEDASFGVFAPQSWEEEFAAAASRQDEFVRLLEGLKSKSNGSIDQELLDLLGSTVTIEGKPVQDPIPPGLGRQSQ